jgi:hypothetical protein
MKKICMALFVLTALYSGSFAGNIDAGRIEIGGGAGFSTNLGDNHSSEFHLSPFAMFYLTQGLALGGSVNLWTSGNSQSSRSGLDLGPRIAYYFDIGNPTLFPYVAGGINFSSWSSSNHDHGSSHSIPIEGGLRLFLNDFVAANAGLNLDFRDGYTNMSIGVGLSMFLR